ncbi:MAG: NfeD family protein [Pseudomonadota bacterium]
MSLFDNLMNMHPAIGWAIAGVLLLIAEVLITTSFLIPFSAAAFIVALLVWLKLLPMGLLWQGLIFSILGVCLIPLSRKLLLKVSSKTPDVNQY